MIMLKYKITVCKKKNDMDMKDVKSFLALECECKGKSTIV